ncbi:hypothetical protein KC19_7G016300 [Ceratodon purpureus]|uniref:NnrU domain-containing protein n=1 Tax=Ceratodon purpureus TaxID=3225 RepID=A0A8T0H143_CERPU|nr:hypothetical protein KC19_7G016300 [Ceratodon purpureus]
MAQAGKCVVSSAVALAGVGAVRSLNARRLSDSAGLFRKPGCFLPRFELGSAVFSERWKYLPSGKLFIGRYHEWICSAKGHGDIDDGSSPRDPPSQGPPHVPFTASEDLGAPDCGDPALVGEDSAAFDITSQSTSSWLLFTAILGVALAVLYVVWIDPETGYGSAYIDAISSLSSSHEVVMLIILFTFALVHSGLASLRGAGEKLIGERAYRVIYAATSLPLAVSAVVYFMNHRCDGMQLWDVRSVFGVHELVWAMSFISFFFLYPSTFNLLEVAAVDEPKVHMWETGIMRITRHPQMVGQFLWCFAHTLWIGNSFTVTTSLGLLAHHLFGVWHGDKRLSDRHGEAYRILKERTSILPFAAILDGRQKLPRDYYKEFLRVPYLVIACLTIAAYWSQALLQSASQYLRW